MPASLLRFFVRCFVGSLGLYASSVALALGARLVASEAVAGVGVLVGYGAIYCFFASLGLLVLAGGTTLLLRLLGWLPAATPPAEQVADTCFCALIGKVLTQYQEKHSLATELDTLCFSLVAFEKALQSPLPPAAYEQPAWWTAASAHSQQWVQQGWQVTAVALREQEPTVTFTSVKKRASPGVDTARPCP